jgi:hypothetical protein
MIKRIKELSIGSQRLIFFASFIIAFLSSVIFFPSYDIENGEVLAPFIFIWLGYWVIVRIVLWIIDGYK